MDSPLLQVLANLFMESFEQMALDQAPLKLTYFKRYVDDISIVWPHGKEKFIEFFNFLNNLHMNIRFTMEMEAWGQLPFLDSLVYHRDNCSLGQRVYKTPTHTDIYLNAARCHHPTHKKSVLSTLVHRAQTISDRNLLQGELHYYTESFPGKWL